MRSALIALFTLWLVSLFSPVVSAFDAKSAEGGRHKLLNGWELYIHGNPPKVCALMKVYGGGPWGLTLLRNDHGQWVVQVTNATWLMPPGSPINFTFKFDDEPGWDQKGRAVNFKSIQTVVGQEFIYRWKAYGKLKITMNGSEMIFDLIGTANGTQVLEQCARSLSTRSCGKDCA